MTLSQLIKERLEARGISVRQASARSNGAIKFSTLARLAWPQGEPITIDWDVISALAAVLEVSEAEILACTVSAPVPEEYR